MDTNETQQEDQGAPEPIAPELCVKALGGKRLGVYLMLFGDNRHKDLEGTWFTLETKAVDSVYKAIGAMPALYHHGYDAGLGAAVIGKTDVMERDSVGWWIETSLDIKGALVQGDGDDDWLQEQLSKAEQYEAWIADLVRTGTLRASSGAIPGGARFASDGEILEWPVYESTYTVTPAEWRMIDRPATEIRTAYRALGLQLPEQQGAEDAQQKVIEQRLGKLRLLRIRAELL